jgi:hypothetical protein
MGADIVPAQGPRRRHRVRALVVLLAAGAALVLASSPATAGTITAPPPGFTVPLDRSQKSGLGLVTIAASGFPPGANVSVMICNGNSPSTDVQWDPNSDCDSGTAPAAAIADSKGNVAWSTRNPARDLVFFDGSNPSATFDCLYSGQPDPADGLKHWGGGNPGDGPPCQIIVTTQLVQATSDQVLEPFKLPKVQASCTGSCDGAPAPSSAAGQAAGAPTAAVAPSQSTTTEATAAADAGGADIAADSSAGSAAGSASGHLAWTGFSPATSIITAGGLLLIGLGCLVVSRRKGAGPKAPDCHA